MRRDGWRVAMAVAACSLAGVSTAAPAAAGKRKIEVRPGTGAIARALDRARDGDVLRLHRGRYREALTIEKGVKLVAAGKRRPVIDGECGTPFTVAVRHHGVRLKRLKVVGAGEGLGFGAEVDFRGVSRGKANDLVLRDTCDADYGVNAFDTGAIRMRNSRALGFDDAGFYIGEIGSTPGGVIRLQRSDSYANNRGVIVENSAGGDIRVTGNDLHDNTVHRGTGVLLNNSDGVLVDGNRVAGNGTYGLRLTDDSDGNVITNNLFRDNPIDVLNEGAGNCGSGNLFETGDALPPC